MAEVVPSQTQIEQDPDAERALELGIDLSLIDENLHLTPLERMRQHDQCVRQMIAVQERIGVHPIDES